MAHVVGSIGGPFSQLVMSGGGLRCLWQGGFLDIARDPLALSPQRVIGVSGGALSAARFLAPELFQRAAELSISRPTLNRAKKEAGAVSKKKGKNWEWRLERG